MNRKGLASAISAYVLWGLFPIYWKWLSNVSTLQVVAHRVVWSFFILLGILFTTQQLEAFQQATIQIRIPRIYLVTAGLIGVNWLVYVWAVNAGFIVEASLGYYINPLISVLMGVLFLRERMRTLQWIPIVLAALGVIYLSMAYGRIPWVALTLAFTFSAYGLLKKLSPLGPLHGLTLETGALFLPALLYLMYKNASGAGVFMHSNWITNLLLIGAGVITSFTLFMFASATQKLPLYVVGLMEYIAPTLAFLLGVFIYREPFKNTQMISFGIVWFALIIFVAEGFISRRNDLTENILDVHNG